MHSSCIMISLICFYIAHLLLIKHKLPHISNSKVMTRLWWLIANAQLGVPSR